jgi:hypothetical protein
MAAVLKLDGHDNTATMSLNNLFDDGESQTTAVRRGGGKTILTFRPAISATLFLQLSEAEPITGLFDC